MQVSVEAISTLGRKMSVEVPRAQIEQEIQKRLNSLTRTAKINGFRPGKVPLRVIQQKYGAQVRQEVIGELVQSSFYEAVEQEKLHPAGQPSIDFTGDITSTANDLAYIADFEVYPELNELTLDKLSIEKITADIADSDIDGMLDKLREQRKVWNDIDAAAEDGHRIVIDFVGTVDGEAFEGNEVKQLPLILGRKNFILPGLEEGLLGAKAGEDRELDLDFPEDYKNEQLAGKTVHFKVHVESVASSELPEIDDEFTKSLGVEDGTVESLRKDISENMARELEFAIKAQLKQRVLKALLEANPVEVPEVLVSNETNRLAANMKANYENQGIEDFQPNPDEFKTQAEDRVKLGLLIAEIIKINELTVDPEKVREMIESVASTYEEPDAIIQWYYAEKQRLQEVESVVLEEQVVNWLLERADVSEKQLSFDEVMQKDSDTSQAEA